MNSPRLAATRLSATALLILAGFSIISCGRDPFSRLKDDTRKRYAAESPELLVAAPVKELTLTPKTGPSEDVKVSSGTFSIPKPDRLEPIKRGQKAAYPGFTVHIDAASKKSGLQKLPAAWGADEIDKMFFICSASGKLIDDAKDKDELSAAIVLLAARGSLAPMGSGAGVRKITTPHFKGLLSGDFGTKVRMEITLLPAGCKDEFSLMVFTKDGPGTTDDVLNFLSGLSFQASEKP